MKKVCLFGILGLSLFQTVKADTFSYVLSTGNIKAQNQLVSDGAGTIGGNLTVNGAVIMAPLATATVDKLLASTGLTVGYSGNPVYQLLVYGNMKSSGPVQANGGAFLGSYTGGFALTVNSTDGSVVLKKAQGDISMGIYQ